MTPAEKILERLEGVQGRERGPWMARCPAHHDRTASLRITLTDAGVVLLYCHAGCGAADILESVGLCFFDLYPPRESQQTRPTPVERNARLSLQTIAHAALTAATLLGNVARTRRCSEPQADLAVRLALDIKKALDAAGIKPVVLSERKRA